MKSTKAIAPKSTKEKKPAASTKGEDDGEEKKPSFLGTVFNQLFGPSNAARAMMAVFDTSDGKLKDLMKQLQINSTEKKRFLNMWLEIDGDRNNKMDYGEFISYFNLSDDVWSKRVFGIINYNATDVVSFVEFFSFCISYLQIDYDNTIEFTFRLLSRRGHIFNRAHHPIIDLDDMKFYLTTRCGIKNLSKCKKRAGDIFKIINKNGDGGVEVDEFASYCAVNTTMCAFAHQILMHLRKCIFGIEFWVTKSKKMKLAIGSTLDNLVFFNSINSKSEKFCATLKQPVLDLKGNAIITSNTEEALEEFNESKPNLCWHKSFSMSNIPQSSFDMDFGDILLAKYGSINGRRGALLDQPSIQSLEALAALQKHPLNGSSNSHNASSSDSDSDESNATHTTNSRKRKSERKIMKKLRESIIALTTDPIGPEAEEKMCEEYVEDYLNVHQLKLLKEDRTSELLKNVI